MSSSKSESEQCLKRANAAFYSPSKILHEKNAVKEEEEAEEGMRLRTSVRSPRKNYFYYFDEVNDTTTPSRATRRKAIEPPVLTFLKDNRKSPQSATEALKMKRIKPKIIITSSSPSPPPRTSSFRKPENKFIDKLKPTTPRKSISKSNQDFLTPKKSACYDEAVDVIHFKDTSSTPSKIKKGQTPTKKSSPSKPATPSARAKMIREGSIMPSMQTRTKLHVSYIPDILPCRAKEFSDIYHFLEGKLLDGCGGCTYISGVPATEKTPMVTEVIKQLHLPKFDYVMINGMRLTEPRQSYVEILRQLTGGKTVPWEQARSILESMLYFADAVQYFARKAPSVSGDARRALDICRRAAEVTEKEVAASKENSTTRSKIMAIKHCTRLEKIILRAVVAEMDRTGIEETCFLDVYKMVESLCALEGLRTIRTSLVLVAVSRLEAYGLLMTDQKLHEMEQKLILNVSPDDVHFALRKD